MTNSELVEAYSKWSREAKEPGERDNLLGRAHAEEDRIFRERVGPSYDHRRI